MVVKKQKLYPFYTHYGIWRIRYLSVAHNAEDGGHLLHALGVDEEGFSLNDDLEGSIQLDRGLERIALLNTWQSANSGESKSMSEHLQKTGRDPDAEPEPASVSPPWRWSGRRVRWIPKEGRWAAGRSAAQESGYRCPSD